MKKVNSSGGGIANVWSSFQKVSGFTFKIPTYLLSIMDEKWKGILLENLNKFFQGKSIKMLA